MESGRHLCGRNVSRAGNGSPFLRWRAETQDAILEGAPIFVFRIPPPWRRTEPRCAPGVAFAIGGAEAPSTRFAGYALAGAPTRAIRQRVAQASDLGPDRYTGLTAVTSRMKSLGAGNPTAEGRRKKRHHMGDEALRR